MVKVSRIIGYYCWETIHHGYLMLLRVLQAETLNAFVLESLLKDICTLNSLGR